MMRSTLLDFSSIGWGRVWSGTAVGTLACIAVAFAIDGYSPDTGTWGWGDKPINNVLIPLVLGIPFFGYLLAKQRQLALAHKELMVLASTDALTSLLNRHAFVTLVERYLDRMEHQQADAEAALLVIDIDHFKQINDTFGHDCGDVALAKVAHAIKDSVREFDVVGRIGGEEFSVLLPGASEERAAAIAERIRSNVFATDLALAGETRHVSVSVGGVTFDDDRDISELLRTADQRLYAAKRAGRNRVVMQQLPHVQTMSLH
jgi:diguanylate cyclase (GGDEF)-like protein